MYAGFSRNPTHIDVRLFCVGDVLGADRAFAFPRLALCVESSVRYRPQSSGASREIGTASILSLRSSSSII